VKGWSDLLATALVGTDRRPGIAAAALLDRAAAASVYRRAGIRPVAGIAPPAPAPLEENPVVRAAAANRLAILADPDIFGDATIRLALLKEWLTEAAGRGWLVPPELLPDLLDLGRRQRELRPLVVAAGGARLAWVAQQNPEWTYILRTEDSSARDAASWHEGTRGQRVAYLTALRRTDPAAGRALLAEEWSALPSDERVDLLPRLAVGLGPDDEEFLESALDDRRREVRLVAADLLSALDGSAYNDRMAARARAGVTVRDGVISVQPPAECDPGLRRDGVVPTPPSGIGERAWWLEQVLARTPLSTWGGVGLLRHSIEEGWDGVVLRGLARAAGSQRDPAWADALLDRVDLATSPVIVAQLFPALGPEELVRRAAEAMRDEAAGLGKLIEYVLEHCPTPWPDQLATAVLTGLEAHGKHRRMPYDLYRVSRIAALRSRPTFAPLAAQVAQRAHGVFEPLAEILQLRYEMIQELE
jgi:hypothetical protein